MWRAAVLIGVFMLSILCGERAWAYSSAHATCDTGGSATAYVPLTMYYPAASCTTLSAGAWATGGWMCLTMTMTAVSLTGGAPVTCSAVNATDDVAVQAPGEFYVNCLDCSRYAVDGVTRAAAPGRVAFFQAGVPTGGCVLSGGSYACPRLNLIGCVHQGGFWPCAVSYRREPDVQLVITEIVNAQNFGVVGLLSFVFLGAFAWGWRFAHGSTTQ